MKLFSPLNYLRIRHSEKKWYDFIIPSLGAVLAMAVYFFCHDQIPLVGSSGLIVQVNGLLQVLIGFYIAALAAVSTFSNSSIDEVMAGDPPTLLEKFRGTEIKVELTRRRFVCFLFGYLALMSFILFSVGLVSILLGKMISAWIVGLSSIEVLWLIKTVFVGFYSLILINLISTTLLGLYYLSVRFHQSSL